MVVGIRGTCGWVTDKTAALLEGVVTVTAGEQEVTISAGEMAVMTAEGALEVKPLSADSVPDFVREEQAEDSALVEEEVKDDSDSGIDVLASVDPLNLRDMYTYSRMLKYNTNGVLIETEYFPDEQGRIGREVSHGSNPNTGMEATLETIYIYNDEGTLQTTECENGVIYTITENTADHRKMVRGDADWVYIYYYDEQGYRIRWEIFHNGERQYQRLAAFLSITDGIIEQIGNSTCHLNLIHQTGHRLFRDIYNKRYFLFLEVGIYRCRTFSDKLSQIARLPVQCKTAAIHFHILE